MKELFSIIIPTLWRSELLLKMLPVYQASAMVAEIIIIDNNHSQSKPISMDKVVYINPGKNIYVNPAWNLGASLAKHTIVLANDDLYIQKLDALLLAVSHCKLELIGASVNNHLRHKTGIQELNKEEGFPRRSFGCFMVCRSYKYIPEQLRIYSGDRFLFESASTVGRIGSSYISTPISETMRSNEQFYQIGGEDVIRYRQIAKRYTELNIIIRTSGRPNYFKNCIKSIRKHAPDARLHISIDNEADADYVNKNCEGLNYATYLINRDTVSNFCEKKIITRKKFIYNHYFNIIQPFINGYVMFLDDDDQLLMKPKTNFNVQDFHLYRVAIVSRVVPENEYWEKIILNHISGLSVVFHSSAFLSWKAQRGGDFDFINELSQNLTPIWHDCILSQTQTGGNNGRRNDLAN